MLWEEGGRGQPCARARALEVASELTRMAASVNNTNGGMNGGAHNAHERAALVQSCRLSAAWGVAEGRCSWKDATDLYDLALKTCGGSNGGTGGGLEEEVGELCDTHAAYAAWLDAEHRAATHLSDNSPDELRRAQLYESAQRELQAATDEVANLPPKQSKATKELQEGLKKKIALLRSHVEKHDQQDERRRENRLHLAETALRQHAACARSGRAHDHTSLFAIVGLWLEYGGGLTAAKDELLSIPTHKLLPLISQLACRLGPLPAKAEDEDEHTFQTALRQVLLRVARAHIHVA